MPQPRLPLVVTADTELLDDILRLAAAGGSDVEVAPDPAGARPRYGGAPLVVVGLDQLQPCVRARLPHRTGVIVAGRGTLPDDTWPLAHHLGPVHVISLPDAETWLVNRFAERPDPGTRARVLAVIGGRGGAGASILAGGVAMTASKAGHRTLLVDGDPLGGGLDLLFGWENVEGVRWPALADAEGRVDPPALLEALPHRGDLVLLSFDREQLPAVPSEAMAATLDAGRRGRDLIVADLPRHLDDAAALALQAADRTVLIVPAELRATAAAVRVARAVRLHCEDVALVVRGPAPGKLRPRQVAEALGLPLAGALRPDPGMCQALERGQAPAADGKGPLAELCRNLVKELVAA